MPKPHQTLEERFWAKVEKTKTCWIWRASQTSFGHGTFAYYKSAMLAHRVAYILTYGALLPNVVVAHLCPNPACVRPSHLRVKSPLDNNMERGHYLPSHLPLMPVVPTKRLPFIERVWQGIQQCGHDFPCPYCCWPWMRTRGKFGYGTIRHNGKTLSTHRVIFELWHNIVIPTGLCVCHYCDIPFCNNPAHLWLGTSRQNTQDRHRKGRTVSAPHRNFARGERNGLAKLAEEQVRHIRALHSTGLTSRQIAGLLSLPLGTIADVVYYKTWKHI